MSLVAGASPTTKPSPSPTNGLSGTAGGGLASPTPSPTASASASPESPATSPTPTASPTSLPLRASEVHILPATLTLWPGATLNTAEESLLDHPSSQQLSAYVYMSDGSTLRNVQWAVSNPEVAMVSPEGIVRILASTSSYPESFTVSATSADGHAVGYALVSISLTGQAGVTVQ